MNECMFGFTVSFGESCKSYKDFASKLTVIPNIHQMFRFWLVSFFGCVFFYVAFLIKFRYGNGGEIENGNVTCGDPHQVSTMEDNNSRGKFFIIDGLMYWILMPIIVLCYKVLNYGMESRLWPWHQACFYVYLIVLWWQLRQYWSYLTAKFFNISATVLWQQLRQLHSYLTAFYNIKSRDHNMTLIAI